MLIYCSIDVSLTSSPDSSEALAPFSSFSCDGRFSFSDGAAGFCLFFFFFFFFFLEDDGWAMFAGDAGMGSSFGDLLVFGVVGDGIRGGSLNPRLSA